MSGVFDIASSIIFLAMLAVIVKNKNSASILSTFGSVFTNSLKTAEAG